MAEELLVRLAEDRDIEALAKFNMALAWETEQKKLELPVVTEGLRTLLNNPRHGFYTVAEVAGRVVGCIMITYEWSDWRCGQFWWIQSVYVDTDFRRRGIFRRLYEFLKEKASREQNVCGFRLYVEHSNLTGQSTYAGVGMEEASYKFYEESFEN
ncbi:MAG: GNAT family N-acetyltransferase [Phycisphaerales bacterium]|nr:MAG: GNAT family N-acetyltransferase [Phycisphaerales bacterium]